MLCMWTIPITWTRGFESHGAKEQSPRTVLNRLYQSAAIGTIILSTDKTQSWIVVSRHISLLGLCFKGHALLGQFTNLEAICASCSRHFAICYRVLGPCDLWTWVVYQTLDRPRSHTRKSRNAILWFTTARLGHIWRCHNLPESCYE